MKKKFINFLIVFLFPLIIFGQLKDINCGKIKNGTFYFYPEKGQKAFAIVREGSTQKEINLKTGDTSFWKINWKNDCSFDLKFIRKSKPISDDEKSFYSSHISVFKVLRVTKDYYLFKAGLDSISSVNVLTDTLWLKSRQSRQ